MDLKSYSERYSITSRELAESLDVSVSAVRKWLQGTRNPRLAIIKKIDKLTEGSVSYDDWN